jgi:uncharacterized OsmC-like protein
MSVTRRERGVRVAKMPVDGDVLFGVHGELAEEYSKYAKEPDGYEPHASTLDYMVVCVGACLIDHFGAALEVRGFPTRDGQLSATIRGELDEDRDCPVSRTLRGNVEIVTDYELASAATRVS